MRLPANPARVQHLLRPLLTSAPRSGNLAVPSVHRDTMQISRGKFDRLPRTPSESTAPVLVERTLRIRARSSDQDCLIFGFCPSGRGFASALLSDGSSRRPPLRLASPLSHQTWAEDFHLQAVKHALHTRPYGNPKTVSTGTWKSRTEREIPTFPQPITSSMKENKNGKNDGCDPSSHQPAAGKVASSATFGTGKNNCRQPAKVVDVDQDNAGGGKEPWFGVRLNEPR